MHLLIPSHFNGNTFNSNWRDTLGCSLPTPKNILAALNCILSIGASYTELPHTSAPYNNTESTNISKIFKTFCL